MALAFLSCEIKERSYNFYIRLHNHNLTRSHQTDETRFAITKINTRAIGLYWVCGIFVAIDIRMRMPKLDLHNIVLQALFCLCSANVFASPCSKALAGSPSPLDYQKIISPSHLVTLSPEQKELLEDYRLDLSYDITGYQRHGMKYLKTREGLLGHLGENLSEQEIAEVLEDKINSVAHIFTLFPRYEGYVFRSVDIGLKFPASFAYWINSENKSEFAKYLFSLKSGDIINNKEFWSTSKSLEVVTDISSEEKIIFIVKSRSGRDLANHAGTEWRSLEGDDEEEIPSHEVVFLPGQEFKVLDAFNGSIESVRRFIVLDEL